MGDLGKLQTFKKKKKNTRAQMEISRLASWSMYLY